MRVFLLKHTISYKETELFNPPIDGWMDELFKTKLLLFKDCYFTLWGLYDFVVRIWSSNQKMIKFTLPWNSCFMHENTIISVLITFLQACVQHDLCVSHLRTVSSPCIYSGLWSICGPVFRSVKKNAEKKIMNRTESHEYVNVFPHTMCSVPAKEQKPIMLPLHCTVM